MTKYLSREEWNQLDTLIGKIGFGGYYDMLEYLDLIRTDLSRLAKIETDKQKNLADMIITIRGLVNILEGKVKK